MGLIGLMGHMNESLTKPIDQCHEEAIIPTTLGKLFQATFNHYWRLG